jgi:hypothetical protein
MAKHRHTERIKTLEQSELGNTELPAYKHKQEIIANIEAYKAVILGGQTGSGKSTQVPQFLYEAGYDLTVVMVPRRVIAEGLTERIREEMAGKIKDFNAIETVGVVHGERTELHANNRIIITTPNTYNLMETDLKARHGDKKVAIIADEIHEANLFTEIATGVAATSVRDLEKWRLIAASATHNAETLKSSFQKLNGGFVPTIEIEGRPFGIELQEDPVHTPMQVYAKRGQDHQKSMIFTSGKREIDHIIEETAKELELEEKGSSGRVMFRKLHGELSRREISHINDEIPEGYRLVIVSSPAGMSGITIPGVTLVVTDGTINRQELDDDGVAGLMRRYLSKAEITQQIGRAGRDVEGGIGILAKPTTVMDDLLRSRGKVIEESQMEYLPLDERDEHAPPEIYSSNLSRVVLTVAALDRRFGDINAYLPHPQALSPIIAAEETLVRLGALDDDLKITGIGDVMNGHPIIPELARGLYEATRPGHTLQHMARAAFIAVAVDSGGLQDFSQKSVAEWKKLVRPETQDDFLAQLDIMMALEDNTRTGGSIDDFVEEYTLSPKRVERATKAARDILHGLGYNIENIIVTPPTPDEETALRHDFTAGMIDLVFEEVGKSYRKTTYRNIHGDENSTVRTISDRSVSSPPRGQLVAGIPRWYKQKKRGNVEVHHDIIGSTLHVDAEVVGSYADKNNLLVGQLDTPRVEGGRVVEREQRMFGSIPVGEMVTTVWREHIPESSRKLLIRESLQNPGDAQRALREIADELARYRTRIPPETLSLYRRDMAPEDITKEFIKELIEEATKYTRNLAEIDHRLGQYIYSKNVTINRYFEEEAREMLKRLSRDTVSIGNDEIRILYDGTQPYTTQITPQQRGNIKKPLYLEDGRKILVQVAGKGKGIRRV